MSLHLSADTAVYVRALVRIGGMESAARILNVTPDRLAALLRAMESGR